jgi:hypothetical protein
MIYSVLGGGKGPSFWSGSPPNFLMFLLPALKVAAVIELIQAYSWFTMICLAWIIECYGKPCHKGFGEATATLWGMP